MGLPRRLTAAFRSLYDLQPARFYGLALHLTRQPELATDVVHDAFLQVWQRASQFDRNRCELTTPDQG